MAAAEWRIMAGQSDKQPRREGRLSLRIPKDKIPRFWQLYADSGFSSVNAFIFECVFGRNRIRPAEIKLLARILAHGQGITDALKPFNIAAARDPEIRARLDEIRLILTEIRSALFSLMGRKP